MQRKVLVGAEEFMHALALRAQEATDSLYIQAMTFEGDTAGEALIDMIINSPAKDKRLIVDCFSKAVVSDHFVFGPKYLKDADFRKEIANGSKLVKKAEANGVRVKYVNPTGPMMMKYPLRNHKKMMIVDGKYSFIGGINFSEHNFQWHDMMVELEDDKIGGCLAEDFNKTWQGINQSDCLEFDDSTLWFFNGIKSKKLYEGFFDRIAQAKESVTVVSPYVSEPLLGVLREAAGNGVKVEIVSPRDNNKSIFTKNLIREAKKGYFGLLHYPGMFHLKAMLIDNETLVFGSSNYDLVSYYFEQEVVITTNHAKLVSSFIQRVLKNMRSASEVVRLDQEVSGNHAFVVNLLSKTFSLLANHVIKPL